ncbi:MAG TPA: proton-conducting transporter membrane subunit [Labilithrix sp.]|nr:proton-conducting transporter membrane subunit [Labilithrix sp.]
MTDGTTWVAWSVIFPLGGALTTLFFGRRGAVLAIPVALGTLGVNIRLAALIHARGTLHHRVGGWGAPLGIELRADGAAALMLVAFSVVGALVSVYALTYFSVGHRRSAYFALWLLAWAALDALLVSNDVFNLYVALELLTLTAVGLIALEHHRTALASAFRYLILALAGSLGYLVGVALLYGEHATLDIGLFGKITVPSRITSTGLAMMTVGLCLKAALFPLHAWLPPAYASASPPVSALLSGLIGKTSFLVLLRVWPELVPTHANGGGPAQLLGALAGTCIVWGSLLALRQRRLKALIAYSSLAHVGYMFLFFPLGTQMAKAGVVYLAISHAAASAAMFTATGTIERDARSDDIAGLKGVAHRRPLTFFAIGIAGTSLMGLPPSGGFIAKWLIVRSALECGQWWWAFVALAGGLMAAGYVFRILRIAFLNSSPLDDDDTMPAQHKSDLLPLALALVSLALGIAPRWPLALLEGAPS